MKPSILRNRSRLPLAQAALSGLLMAGIGVYGCVEDTPAGTDSNALITLTSPQGGEVFKIGDTVWVKWNVKDHPDAPQAVDPVFSPDDGKTWKELTQSIGPTYSTWRKWGWEIPDSLDMPAGRISLSGLAKCRMEVRDYITPSLRSGTRSTFSIQASP